MYIVVYITHTGINEIYYGGKTPGEANAVWTRQARSTRGKTKWNWCVRKPGEGGLYSCCCEEVGVIIPANKKIFL